MNHVELHNHTYYSILDGASSPAEYLARAKELGMSHLAITDHGTTTGHREFQREAKEAGIKPILGVEAYITTDRFDRRTAAKRQDGTGIYNHITLLAQNPQGLDNLEKMNKIAWSEGFFHKPRIDIELLEQHSDGIIALSGCMSGMIAKSLTNEMDIQAESYAIRFKEILGDRFFIEVMESNSEKLNNQLMNVANRFNIKPVITSDCHMASKEDRALAEAMLILNTKPSPRKIIDFGRSALLGMLDAINYMYPERKMTFVEFELWLHKYEEHVANLEKHGIGEEPVQNTMLIADMIEDYPYYENLDTLPKFDVEDEEKELRRLVYEGLKNRGMDKDQVNIDRVEEELGVINAKKLAGYFLIEKDFIDYSVKNDILTGYGRGSAVSYLTNYALGITKIDPMPYNLLPERFLSLDREDPADIDTDFAIDGRYKVKNYAQRKYHNVSNISTIGYYKDKSAIKAAAKVFKAPFGETTKLTNKVTTIAEFESHPDTADFRKKYPHVVALAKKLNGRIQNFGMHAGGIILSKEPIENTVTLQTAKDPSDDAADRVPVAGLDMRELADIGFIKYDLLGLRTLSIVDDTINLVKQRHGVTIDIEDIPLDDANIYNMISEGRTSGLFQAEAGASTKVILEMGGVSNFLELVASNALVRPGAANSTVGETYIHGKKTGEVSFIHEDMREVTAETYGAVLYQEQQLLLCQRIAGMSQADANKVRKAVSKKIPEDLAIWKPEFIAGASEKVGATVAEKIWKDLEASADYAFAKAHAVGYSMLTLLTAYLKYYYPIEFLTSSLNRMKTSNKSDRMKMIKYMVEAKRMGIRIKLPHVNDSGANIEIGHDDRGDFIMLGLSQIKYISDKTAQPLIRNRPFKNYASLKELAETKHSGISAATLNALNAIGAANFGDNPKTGLERENFFQYLSIPAFETKDIDPYIFSQFRDLVDYTEDETFVCMGIVGGDKKKPGWRLIDMIDETGIASAFVPEDSDILIGEVYVFLIANNSVVDYITTSDINGDVKAPLKSYLSARELSVPETQLKVVSFTPRTTKAGKKMATVVFTDEYKNLTSAQVWPTLFMKGLTMCKPGALLDVKLTETDDGTVYVDNMKLG